ncbi:MAG: peptide chain release factor N(5)-glutamine methyltransferase [Hominenteromicrobium sp.]
MTVREAYNRAKKRLAAAADDPAFEAVCLTEQYFGMARAALLTHGERLAPPEAERAFFEAVERRVNGEPLQYILGEWAFMGLALLCGEGVLIPREDTAVLVEAVCARLERKREMRGLDLCAGTGAVGLAIARETGAAVTAVEKFSPALAYLEANLARYPALSVRAVQGDVLRADFAEAMDGPVDFIASNPPYIGTAELPGLQREVRREPQTALDGGADGLVFYRAISALWVGKLRPGGVLAVEIGETQGAAVTELFRSAGLSDIRIHTDMAGLDRAVSGIK